MACSNDSVRRGNLGKVKVDGTNAARLKAWDINHVVDESAWGDSDSGGFTNRVPGREDATGSMTGVFDNDNPVYALFAAGDIVTLVLFENTTSYWYFACALIKSYAISYNMDTKEAVEWKSDWAADGVFYKPGAAGAPVVAYV